MKFSSRLALAILLTLGLHGFAHADITIAVALPISGGLAAFGDEMRAGADLAAEDVNAKGGVLGEKIVLQYFDDACSNTQAVTVANKIIGQHPVAAFADLCSAATLASAPVYAEAGLPQITLSSNPKITDSGYTHLFRIGGRDDREAPDLVRYMAAGRLTPKSKIAVLDDQGAWGVGVADSAVKTLKQMNLPFARRDSVTSGQKDFSAIITRLKQDDITDVVLGVYLQEAALLVRQAREQGFKGNFYGGDATQSSEFWKIAGPAAEGMILSGLYDSRDTPAGKNMVERLKKAGRPFSSYSFYGYAGVEVLAQAIEQAKSKKSDSIIAALRSGHFTSIIGPIAYDAKGDLKDYHFQIFAWHKGDYAAVPNAK